MCYLDLDGFKEVNDQMGHEAGDRVLIEMTRRIQSTIRADDTVARLGGDEFVVLLSGLKGAQECTASLDRLLDRIGQPVEIQQRLFHVGASIGVVIAGGEEADPDTLLRQADQAMYVAKQSGKHRYHLYDAETAQRERSRQSLLKRLSRARSLNELVLYYQPKIDLRSGALVGWEALIRWQDPQRGLVPPGDFLPLVEHTPMEIELGDWVIRTALAQLDAWHQAGLTWHVSINIAAHHLQHESFALKLEQALMRHPRLPRGSLQIELLETAALEDMPYAIEVFERCRMLGVDFALDDFGTGYSSLTYLGNLPVDTVKIDQSFVTNMSKDSGSRAIVQGVIALSKAFERRVVAEGVESRDLCATLREMGCDEAQGYAIAKPMLAAEVPGWALRWAQAAPPGNPA